MYHHQVYRSRFSVVMSTELQAAEGSCQSYVDVIGHKYRAPKGESLARLQAELGAQQAQIVQLQHAILDLYTQQERAAIMGGAGMPAGGDGTHVYDHATHRLVPGGITATAGGLGYAHGGVDTSSGVVALASLAAIMAASLA